MASMEDVRDGYYHLTEDVVNPCSDARKAGAENYKVWQAGKVVRVITSEEEPVEGVKIKRVAVTSISGDRHGIYLSDNCTKAGKQSKDGQRIEALLSKAEPYEGIETLVDEYHVSEAELVNALIKAGKIKLDDIKEVAVEIGEK